MPNTNPEILNYVNSRISHVLLERQKGFEFKDNSFYIEVTKPAKTKIRIEADVDFITVEDMLTGAKARQKYNNSSNVYETIDLVIDIIENVEYDAYIYFLSKKITEEVTLATGRDGFYTVIEENDILIKKLDMGLILEFVTEDITNINDKTIIEVVDRVVNYKVIQ